MNKPILMPQLSATRARTGMRSIGELMSLLIKQYELQDQLRAKQQAAAAARRRSVEKPVVQSSSNRVASTTSASGRGSAGQRAASKKATAQFSNSRTSQGVTKPVQATFAWFDSASAEPASV